MYSRTLARWSAGEPGKSQVTEHAGPLPYMDLACVLGMLETADEEIGICGSQGWMDRDCVLSLALLSLVGDIELVGLFVL